MLFFFNSIFFSLSLVLKKEKKKYTAAFLMKIKVRKLIWRRSLKHTTYNNGIMIFTDSYSLDNTLTTVAHRENKTWLNFCDYLVFLWYLCLSFFLCVCCCMACVYWLNISHTLKTLFLFAFQSHKRGAKGRSDNRLIDSWFKMFCVFLVALQCNFSLYLSLFLVCENLFSHNDTSWKK